MAAPTIYDVAKAAGVSPSTVSRALSKPGRINARTEQHIRETAQSLGYRLNPMARAVITGKTGTIALILSDVTKTRSTSISFEALSGPRRGRGARSCLPSPRSRHRPN